MCGIELKNPFILSSGILGISRGLMQRVEGAGAIVTKSIGREERRGYENPTLVELDHGLLNAMGLPNPGVEEFVEELSDIGTPVIGSIIAEPGCDEVASILEPYVEAMELNLSCPHVTGCGADIALSAAVSLVKSIKRRVKKPLLVKLGFDQRSAGDRIFGAGADGIVAMNTIRAMAIDVDMRRPILSNRFGGYSGPAIKPIGVCMVYELYEMGGGAIIGCGGITNWRDVIEYMMAGASSVEIGSGVFYHGLGIFRELEDGVKEFLHEEGFRDIGEIVGLAHG
jgi:dihydroorotate dehydrogenase (NAD+) catalytic subunit